MPTDYQSKLNEQLKQARLASGDASTPMPDRPDAGTPVTREEVQSVINSLVESIKSMVIAQETKFVTRGNLEATENNILQSIYGLNYTTKRQALRIAKDAVPPSLRGLDSDETRKRGDTLKLIPGHPTGSDQAIWDEDLHTPFDWSKCAFGYSVDPDGDESKTKVRIMVGEINRHVSTQTDLTIAGTQEVWAKLTIADDTIVIEQGAAVPDDDDTYLYYRLYQFTITASDDDPPVDKIDESLTKIYRPFDIEAGGAGGGGLSAEGDQVLYKGVFLREYDGDGVIVAPGSDINPADYATQALYEAALTAAGHTLKYTNDWARVGTDITP